MPCATYATRNLPDHTELNAFVNIDVKTKTTLLYQRLLHSSVLLVLLYVVQEVAGSLARVVPFKRYGSVGNNGQLVSASLRQAVRDMQSPRGKR